MHTTFSLMSALRRIIKVVLLMTMVSLFFLVTFPGQAFATSTMRSVSLNAMHQGNSGSDYDFFVGAVQVMKVLGASGSFTQHEPSLASQDSLSSAKLSVESADGQQAVIIGWMVNPQLYNDTNPHLHVYTIFNGQNTCPNGCGYVQTSKKLSPGMKLPVTDIPQSFTIMHDHGNWWLQYQNEWIGYFPDSLWSSQGVTFNKAGAAQWFGEAINQAQMGDGLFGTRSGSALVQNMQVKTTNSRWIYATASPIVTNSNCYNTGNFSGSSFHYGGPGC